MRYLFVLAALACAAVVYAAEPPVIQSEPPAIVSQCECVNGGPCLCDDCACTVPVIAPLVREDSHNCPKCGTFQNIVEREFGGSHSHLCKSCGTEWVHADPGVSLPSVQYIIAPPRNPLADNCPGGNCPKGAAPRIVGAASVVRSVYGLERGRVFNGERRPLRRLLGVVFRGRGCN